MPEPSTRTAPPALAVDAPRIVLFGMPAAGKSSLLGALAQAAQLQEHLLNGRLTDRTQGLAELQHRLYDETPRRTVEEVVPYAIEFEPFAQDGPASTARGADATPLAAVLIDCDGRVANDLLTRRRSLAQDSPEGSLAREIQSADTLVLVVDASAPAAQIDADFIEFDRFLRLLERGRGQRSDVGGLPVYLVLTKCDLLAKPEDTAVDWMERIEERKRQVDARFHEFLARRASEQGPLPFGRIDLHLWAAAVKRPALSDSPARPREPYGVAELFRQCLDSARSFRARRRQSSRRLFWTVAGTGTIVAGMILLTAALLAGVGPKAGRQTELQRRLESFRARDAASPAERLRGRPADLEDRIGRLTELHADPEFGKLPAEDQAYLEDRLNETRAYLLYLKRIQSSRKPADVSKDEELQQIEEALKSQGEVGLALPRPEWSTTTAAKLRDERLKQIKALRNAIDEVEGTYIKRRNEGDNLWFFKGYHVPGKAIDWTGWQTAVQEFLSRTAEPPSKPTDPLEAAGLTPELTYETVYRFPQVLAARDELDQVRRKLEGLRDLSTALDRGGGHAKALLDIPASFTLADSGPRLAKLNVMLPDWAKFPERPIPDVASDELRQAARNSYNRLLDAGRDAVLRRLKAASPNEPETPKTWLAVRKWVGTPGSGQPEELADWRKLANVLLGIGEPSQKATDPVTDLASFLDHEHYELSLKRLTLKIPDSLKLRPDGDLTIYHRPAAAKEYAALAFKVNSDKQRDPDRGVTIYTLLPKGDSRIIYKPGDGLFMKIPVLDTANREKMLTWSGGRSLVFQFERLSREPRLHRRDEDNLKGDLEKDIHLIVAQGSIPLLPDLVPVVKLR
jgi:hypothetical protein